MQELISRDEMAHVARWCELVEALAADAEALQAPEAGEDDTHYRQEWQGLADRWMACCWTALTPPFIAASARLARAKVCPQPLQLRDGAPEGYHLISDAEMDQWLVMKSQQQRAMARAAEKAEGTGRRGRPPKVVQEVPETDHEQQVAARRAEYAAKVAAEREAEAQAEAERRAKVLKIAAAAAPAPGPEPEWEEPLEPEALADEKAEPEPGAEAQEPGNDGRVWLPATELAEVLGVARPTVDKWRQQGLFDGLWRLPPGRLCRGMEFDLEGCRAAVEAHRAKPSKPPTRTAAEERERRRLYQAQRRARLREQQQGDPPAAMPVTIEPAVPQGPPVEPSTPAEDGPGAAALLARLTSDPATLEALKALLMGT